MFKFIGLLVAGFVVFLFLSGLAAEGPSDAEQAQKRCASPDAAYRMAQRFINKRLKAPSTADYPSVFSDSVTADYIGDCRHQISAYVDAQNSFSAKVRMPFTAVVENEIGSTTWRLVSLDM